MLRLLTDEHVSPAITRAVRSSHSSIDIECLRDWHAGHLLGADHSTILQEAYAEGRTLVTFDLRTIPPLLRVWAEDFIPHGGVVFVDEKTFPQIDIGGIARALCNLWVAQHQVDWTNRVVFLRG